MRVGVDLIEIDRIERALERYAGFRARCFTDAEREYCDSRGRPAQHYAARFAGKEAVGKDLGSGVRPPLPRAGGGGPCDPRGPPAQHYAARFAGKEAVGKALGCGVRFTWREI